MSYALPLWDTPALPIAGSDELFPVNRIFCVGRNYAAHAREMGHDPDREPPFFFTKFGDGIFTDSRYPYPISTNDLHPECEMTVALSSGGTNIAESDAAKCVFGYGVGFDMTRRDMQQEAKDASRPWALSKGCDFSAPEMIAFLSTMITLKPGDLIMTGTPAGVSAVVKGDKLVGHVDGLTDLELTII